MKKSFNIHNIRNMTHQPNNLKILAFVYISEEIKKLIQNRASQGFYEINYMIPTFVLGYPPYNIIDCASYQYNEFINQHFEVLLGKQNNQLYINISWKKPPPTPPEAREIVPHPKKRAANTEKSSTDTNKKTYVAIENSLNPLKTSASGSKKKKKNGDDTTKTMNFFHSSGFVDTLPVNTAKTSIYL
jgi:hypothetical protein